MKIKQKQKPAPAQNPDENSSSLPADEVKLEPILGIRPGVYLTVSYSIILLAIFFFLLIYPGLKSPDAALIVQTEPAGAAIRVNDVYMGLAGSKIIIPKGIYTIDAVMPGFSDYSAVHEIPGSIFGSSFFPRQKKIEVTLKTDDPTAAFAHYAADFADWTFGGDPTEFYHIPLSLSEGAYRIGSAGIENRQPLNQILLAASRFTSTKTALRDLIRAKTLLDNYGNTPSVSLFGSLSETLGILSETPGSAEWLASLLQDNAASAIRTSVWAGNQHEQPEISETGQTLVPARFELSSLRFTGFNSFMISETPVPRNLF